MKVIFVNSCGDCPLIRCSHGRYYCRDVPEITDIGKIHIDCKLSDSAQSKDSADCDDTQNTFKYWGDVSRQLADYDSNRRNR